MASIQNQSIAQDLLKDLFIYMMNTFIDSIRIGIICFFHGERMHPDLLDLWERFSDDFFPPYALNFFAQHKRPHLSTKQGAAGSYWKSAYFQFQIDQQQQQRLEKLEKKLGDSAVVTYSCPAFTRKDELWNSAKKRKIIRNSNFVSPSKLSGHTRYTFTKPGHRGFANPDPTPIEDITITSKLQKARTEISFTQLIKDAGDAVSAIMADEDRETGDGALFLQVTRQMHKRFGISEIHEDEGDGIELIRAITNVMAFNTINSTSWAVISPPPPEAFEK